MFSTVNRCRAFAMISASFAFVVTAALTFWPHASLAADVSAWKKDGHVETRLIAGATSASAARRAGIQIALAPGWHTYWRYPGDSGVPPRFDFSKSQNVKSVAVLWPAPQRFAEEGSNVIGYKNEVIFPLHVEASNPAKPVILDLTLDFAVCERVCVPSETHAALPITGAASANDAALTAWEAQVPKLASLGATSAFAIRAVHEQDAKPRPRVMVDVAAPAGAKVTLLAEGPTSDWALPLPEPIAGAPAGLQRFAFDLDGVPPRASAKGVMIKLTAIAGGDAIEVSTHLD